MTRALPAGAAMLLLALLTGCDGADAEPLQTPSGDMAYLMGHLLDPAADVIWRSAGSVVTMEGEQDLAPTDDEGWFQVEHSAVVLAEAANLLVSDVRRQDAGDWVEFSQGLGRIGRELIAAAEAQDKDAVFRLGGELYNVCVACHQLYWPEAPR